MKLLIEANARRRIVCEPNYLVEWNELDANLGRSCLRFRVAEDIKISAHDPVDLLWFVTYCRVRDRIARDEVLDLHCLAPNKRFAAGWVWILIRHPRQTSDEHCDLGRRCFLHMPDDEPATSVFLAFKDAAEELELILHQRIAERRFDRAGDLRRDSVPRFNDNAFVREQFKSWGKASITSG